MDVIRFEALLAAVLHIGSLPEARGVANLRSAVWPYRCSLRADSIGWRDRYPARTSNAAHSENAYISMVERGVGSSRWFSAMSIIPTVPSNTANFFGVLGSEADAIAASVTQCSMLIGERALCLSPQRRRLAQCFRHKSHPFTFLGFSP